MLAYRAEEIKYDAKHSEVLESYKILKKDGVDKCVNNLAQLGNCDAQAVHEVLKPIDEYMKE